MNNHKTRCRRCGVADCTDPDSKGCSDNCLSQAQREREAYRTLLSSQTLLIKEALEDWSAGNLTDHSTLLIIHSLINPAKPSQNDIDEALKNLYTYENTPN